MPSTPLLLACPFPGCRNRPDGAFCPLHWRLLPSRHRRATINLLKNMKVQNQVKLDANARRVFTEAFKAIQAAAKAELVAQGQKPPFVATSTVDR